MSAEARKALAAACALVVVFLGYFLLAAATLPGGTGPDETMSFDAVRFFAEHHRLAVLPEDEELLEFSPTGSTRALRPPLAFILSAVLGSPFVDQVPNHIFLARLGPVALGALGVGVTFLFLWTLLRSRLLALAGALLLGLLPQYAYIASYVNDDSAAIFSASVLFLSMALIWRHGIDLKRSALFGLAVGLLVISKPTAWLLAPAALLFVVLFVRVPLRQLVACALVAAAAFMLGGGWWVAHNVRHYGWQDPSAREVQAEFGVRHRRVEDTVLRSFRDQDIGYREMLIGNAQHFWQRTMHSTIGHLGWLELKLGAFQYTFYTIVILGGLLYVPARAGAVLLRGGGARAGPGPGGPAELPPLRFEALLLFAIVVQFAAYVWRNETTEVQLQGKYLLPVSAAVLALFLLGLRRLLAGLQGWFRDRGVAELCLPVSRTGPLVVAVIVAIAVLAHLHAVVGYVVPYYELAGYRPPPRTLEFESVRTWRPAPGAVVASAQVQELRASASGISFRTTGDDPWLLLDGSVCGLFAGNTLLEIDLTASTAGTLAVYWDEGAGLSERMRVKADYPAGRSGVLVGVGTRHCERLRLDPAQGPAEITIHRVEVAGFRVKDPRR